MCVSSNPNALQTYLMYVVSLRHSNSLVFESRSLRDNLTAVCDPTALWLMIVPGWLDDCSAYTAWIPPLIDSRYFCSHALTSLFSWNAPPPLAYRVHALPRRLYLLYGLSALRQRFDAHGLRKPDRTL